MDNTNSASARRSESDGYTRFLNAAEELFATLGYDGTKIRAIAQKSGVNLGALHHYWGSKQALYQAVCERRLRPINDERLRRFDACAAPGRAPSLRSLIEAVVEPPFLQPAGSVRQRGVFRQLLGRALTEPSAEAEAVIRASFEPVSRRFLPLLRAACGHLDEEEFYWRVNAFYGVLVYAPAFSERVRVYAGERFNTGDVALGAAAVVQFLHAGMSAPPAHGSPPVREADSN